jgi:peptidoglycan-N-acetylmuramic acid deacetylase
MKKTALFVLLIIILATLAGCKSNAVVPSNPDQPQVTAPKQEETQPAPAAVAENPVKESAPSSVKTLSWWFTRNQQHQPTTINKDVAAVLDGNKAFYLLPNNNKKIYLTFDCGYELGYTAKILDTLDRKQVKAAFFITGQFIQTQPDLVKRMQRSGHLVCNHTLNHPDLSTLSQDKFNQEIKSLEQKYFELTGVQMPKYLRPPMGNYSPATLKWTSELGYTTVFWSMAYQDWDPANQPGAEVSYKHVMDNIHPGAVILLHAVSQSNTEALERIITDLQAQGYVFSTFGS